MSETKLSPENLAMMLESYKHELEDVERARVALEDKAKFVLTSASVVAPLVTALLADQVAGRLATLGWFWVALGVTLLAYIRLAYYTLKALAPSDYEYPVPLEWKLVAGYLAMDSDTLLEKLISQYLYAVDGNNDLNNDKGKHVQKAFASLGIVGAAIVVTAAAAIIGI